jgi:hypothetical protein
MPLEKKLNAERLKLNAKCKIFGQPYSPELLEWAAREIQIQKLITYFQYAGRQYFKCTPADLF